MPFRLGYCGSVCCAVALLIAVCGCAESPAAQAPPPPLSLTIITPHDAAIRQAFEAGFSEWHRAKTGRQVVIDWIVRGTPQCVRYVEGLFEGSAGSNSAGRPDLMFGGGINDHAKLAKHGRTYQLDLASAVSAIPEKIHGLPTRDPKGNWYATGLSSFGIIYNQRRCAQRDIAAPATWTDLANPAYFGWVAVADPAASGSHTQAMVIMIEKMGWAKGWSAIIRTLANARALAPSSSVAAQQVATGYCLAGYSVNFAGLSLQENAEGIKYVNPADATAVTPDVISVLKTSANKELATRFVEFCLSDEGQATWGVRPEYRKTVGDTLYHYPIDPAVYARYEGKLAVKENPFSREFGVSIDLSRSADEAALIAVLVHAATGDNHVLLQRAWRAVIDSGMNPDALAELTVSPVDPEEIHAIAEKLRSGDAAQVARLREDWTRMFERRYQRVLEICGKGAA